jgi:NAD(P) transhydrogenase subunit alpha
LLILGIFASLVGCAAISTSIAQEASVVASPIAEPASVDEPPARLSRWQVLVMSFTVFTLAVLVGFEIIAKVPPTLHTPLMSGSNAISGITVVGALLAAGNAQGGFACFLGLVALILANINVVGGFLVTHRMLMMFKKK